MGESLQQSLELEGWRVEWWRCGRTALAGLAAHVPDLVICDIRLPDMSGEDIFRSVNAHRAAPPFLFMTAFGQIDQAVSLVRAGAEDYLTKPFDVQVLLDRARWIVSRSATQSGPCVLGVSRAMHDVETLVRRIAPKHSPVLITGETGSGKEVCARLLHQVSPQHAEPFMAVNCAAIPADLLESELFGHEKGAFSGAHQRHLGYAERARGGTLFLDEIVEMPLALQSKLLRVLDERSFHRVGGEAPVPLRARIVCATNRDIALQVQQGCFRSDLFYRINVVTLDVPPLRSRHDDIPWLLSRFFEAFTEHEETPVKGVSTLAEQVALHHPWPGNVRELRNRVERAVALASGPLLMPNDLFPELFAALTDGVYPALPLAAVREAAEKLQIQRILKETGGHPIEAAKRLGVSRTTLWEKMRRHRIMHDA